MIGCSHSQPIRCNGSRRKAWEPRVTCTITRAFKQPNEYDVCQDHRARHSVLLIVGSMAVLQGVRDGARPQSSNGWQHSIQVGSKRVTSSSILILILS